MSENAANLEDSGVPLAETPRRAAIPLFPILRLLAAAAITWGVLIYAWGRSFIIASLTGQPEGYFLGSLLLGVVAVMVLTYHLSHALPWPRLNQLVPWVIGGVWVIECGILMVLSAGPQIPFAILMPLFTLSTLWVVWGSWMFYRPMPWRRRIGTLLLLGLAPVAFPALIRVDGLTGGTSVDFVWRWNTATRAEIPSLAATSALQGHADLSNSTAADYAQYLGPTRSGEQSHVHLAKDWERTPPRLMWRREVGAGWSAFAVVGKYAFTQEQRGPQEVVACYRISDGMQVWSHTDEARFDSSMGGIGPRATPTVADKKVYTVGATGILNALEGTTGALIWKVDILQDNQGSNIDHGVCGSPLVLGEWVIVSPTGNNSSSLVAYDRETGKKVWHAGKDRASYGSPMLTEIDGVRQILLNTAEGLTAHDAATGEILWDYPWTNTSHVNCSQPIPHAGAPDQVFVSTAYGTGSALLKIDHSSGGWTVKPIWNSHEMKTKFTTPVLHEGYVYGLDDGILECVDLTNGKRKWKGGRYQHGQILMSHDVLIVQAEGGEVALVEMDPKRLVELGKIPALTGKTWNNPALAGPYLLVRNDHEAACYRLPVESPADESTE